MNKQAIFTAVAVLVAVGGTAAFFKLNSPQSASAIPVTAPGNLQPTPETPSPTALLNEPIMPLQKVYVDPAKTALGRALFNDMRLSANNTVSCNTCHRLDQGGADGKVHSVGINGAEGDINSLSVFNSSLNGKMFWDGRADSLEDQVDGPTHNPKEMASNWPQIVQKLSGDVAFVQKFNASYPKGVSAENVKDAIATYERSLITTDSRFDKYLRGDMNILTAEEKDGYKEFKSLGCVTCHQGLNVGGNMFQPFGVMADYFAHRGNETAADRGRFNVTGKQSDMHKFRVPGLRNVDLTAPYFHDGSAKTLDEAVRTMVEYQLGQSVTDTQVDHIVAFLKTLTGEQPK